MAEGDLVVTELRGNQQGADNLGQWIELYVAAERQVDLRGLRVLVYGPQGSLEAPIDRPIVVRDELLAEPGTYVTLGHHESFDVPSYIDYSFFGDYFTDPTEDDEDFDTDIPLDFERLSPLQTRDLPGNGGRIDIEACEVLVDRFVYSGLPERGTLTLDGSLTPEGKSNDDPNNLCVDQTEVERAPGTQDVGLPGTPQEANRPCP